MKLEKHIPTFIRMHQRGKAKIRDYNQHYDLVRDKLEGAKRRIMDSLRSPTRVCNLLAYPFGAFDGIIDVLEERQYRQRLRKATLK
jgi:hypothetical protein